MKILAIDTSCDETAAAVTEGVKVLSNIIWSQASQHAEFGGVMPSLAQRMHEERIVFVIERALRQAQCGLTDVSAVAVTAGPGLAIALGVGIGHARILAAKLAIPLMPINHIEGHVLSPLAESATKSKNSDIKFPALGLVISGGHTELILIKKIGEYQIVAKTQDDALGEALDKAARMLGLGYPGGAVLEKMARQGNFKAYPLPLPMARRENESAFSYSGLKTAFYRLIQEVGGDPSTSSGLSARQTYDLASAFQNRAFQHLTRVTEKTIQNLDFQVEDLLVGGGVAANVELRRRLRKIGKELNIKVRFPYSDKLVGDNAAMVGVAAGFKINDSRFMNIDYEKIDRRARWPIDQDFSRE